MNTTTEYKGFSITASANGQFYVMAADGLTVHDGFKADGYSTMNTAKGAITKHVNAVPVSENEFVKSVINLKSQPESNAKEVAQAGTQRAIAAVEALAQVRAVTPSRNKREGKFAGVIPAYYGGRAVKRTREIKSWRDYPSVHGAIMVTIENGK